MFFCFLFRTRSYESYRYRRFKKMITNDNLDISFLISRLRKISYLLIFWSESFQQQYWTYRFRLPYIKIYIRSFKLKNLNRYKPSSVHIFLSTVLRINYLDGCLPVFGCLYRYLLTVFSFDCGCKSAINKLLWIKHFCVPISALVPGVKVSFPGLS